MLVPIDFSAQSREALEYALALGGPLSSSVHVLHAWDLPSYLRPDLTVWTARAAAELADHARTSAEAELESFLTRAGVLDRVEWKLVCGAPYVAILRELEESPYDLVVMGSHGRTGVRHFVLGSVAERVVRHANCPVIAHRRPAP